jgi:E3 ubiquitin-protein ligase DOA10
MSTSPEDDPEFFDLTPYIIGEVKIGDFKQEERPDDYVPTGLFFKKEAFTLVWDAKPWMPKCGICGEEFHLGDIYATATCEELGFSVLICPGCAVSLTGDD